MITCQQNEKENKKDKKVILSIYAEDYFILPNASVKPLNLFMGI